MPVVYASPPLAPLQHRQGCGLVEADLKNRGSAAAAADGIRMSGPLLQFDNGDPWLAGDGLLRVHIACPPGPSRPYVMLEHLTSSIGVFATDLALGQRHLNVVGQVPVLNGMAWDGVVPHHHSIVLECLRRVGW
jgi:hypothetical protein